MGAVMVVIDGDPQFRNVGNATAAPSADGDYEEVDNGAGRSSLIRMNSTSGSDRSFHVISTATTVIRPDGSVMDEIEKQNGIIDKLVETTAVLAGVPETDFQSAPTQPQLKQFGDRLVQAESDIASNDAELAVITNGTYTPTDQGSTGTLNTVYEAQYMRVGNVVTVSGFFDATATSGQTLLWDLPIAPDNNFANDQEGLAGVAALRSSVQTESFAVSPQSASKKAKILVDVDIAAKKVAYTFTYRLDN